MTLLPGKKQITIFVEEPEHPMGFSLAVLPASKGLAEAVSKICNRRRLLKRPRRPLQVEKKAGAAPAAKEDDDEPKPPKEEVNWVAVGAVALSLSPPSVTASPVSCARGPRASSRNTPVI